MTAPKRKKKLTKKELSAIRAAAGSKGGNRRAKNHKRRLKLELPKPSKIEPGSKEFYDLQAQWYGKLADKGFEDIEWNDAGTGKGQNSDYLKGSRNAGNINYSEQAELYYQMARNYVTHVKLASKFDQIAMELHAEGVGYREILEVIHKKCKRKRSLFYLYLRMKQLKKVMLEWNRTAPEGLLRVRQEESDAFDLLMGFEPEPPPN